MDGTGWLGFGVALLLMGVGILGTVVPALPGIPLIWFTMLGFGWIEGFRRIDGVFLVALLAVTLAVEAADYLARMWGARRYGASKAGAWGAALGALAGIFFLPLGLVLGPFLGALIAELAAGRSLKDSLRAGWGGLVGTLGSMVVKFIVAIGMTVAFVVKVV